eukprot:XP_001705888.1 Hypothetical protein GL50803_37813 [Giardia lamblia ATCC 50803]
MVPVRVTGYLACIRIPTPIDKIQASKLLCVKAEPVCLT